jgi:hypothetical protein
MKSIDPNNNIDSVTVLKDAGAALFTATVEDKRRYCCKNEKWQTIYQRQIRERKAEKKRLKEAREQNKAYKAV